MSSILDNINKLHDNKIELKEIINYLYYPALIYDYNYNRNIANPNLFKYSDHLPVISDVNISEIAPSGVPVGVKNIRCATFNVLYQDYLEGFTHSKRTGVTDYLGHIGKYYPQLTKLNEQQRMTGIFDIIAKLMDPNKHHVDILGLQEFSPKWMNALKQYLQNFNFISYITPKDLNPNDTGADWQIILYNNAKMTHTIQNSRIKYYNENNKPKPNKRILDIQFITKNDNILFRFINTHVQYNDLKTLNDHVYTMPLDKMDMYVIIVGDINEYNPPRENTFVLINDKLVNLKYNHINTEGKPILMDFVWDELKWK